MMMQTVQLRDWSQPDICGCTCDHCCYAFFCCCCAVKDIEDRQGGDGMMWCCLYFWCWCWIPFFLCYQRSQMRMKFQIQGDCCNDFCLAWCCHACTLSQMWNEVNFVCG